MAVEMHERGPTEKDGDADTAERPLNILVIHEMLPHPDRHGADVQWMQMLRELRAQRRESRAICRGSGGPGDTGLLTGCRRDALFGL